MNWKDQAVIHAEAEAPKEELLRELLQSFALAAASASIFSSKSIIFMLSIFIRRTLGIAIVGI